MKRYITLDKENRLIMIGSTSNGQDIEIEIDEKHEAMYNPFIYKYENGVLIKDVEYQKELIEELKGTDKEPSDSQRIDGMEFMIAGIMLDSEIKDITIEQQKEKLLETEVTTANLLIELMLKGVI